MMNATHQRKTSDHDDRRRRDLAKIHLAAKQLGLDEATYRECLRTVAGVDSAADLDAAGRKRVIAHFRSKGFRVAHGSAKASGMDVAPSWERKPVLSKIEALLADMGLPWGYADGIARQMFGVRLVRWLKPDQLRAVLVALLKFHKRQTESPDNHQNTEGV